MSKHYHFIGIGGVGMGALASILLAKKYTVSGSDVRENNMTRDLIAQGAVVHYTHDAAHVKGAQVVVYSSAIGKDNPERVAAVNMGVSLIPRARLLAELMQDSVSVTVAGAHGKTTTSSMVSLLLNDAGLNPTTAVGGRIHGSGLSAQLGSGQYFVAETDESDGSFLFFNPDYSIVTNIDFEHADHYGSWENIEQAYSQYMRQTKPKGMLIVNGEDQRLLRLLQDYTGNVQWYGFGQDNHVTASDVCLSPQGSRFLCSLNRHILGEITLSVPGRHNVMNALATVTLGLCLDLPFEGIQKSLKSFQGVQRRFQILNPGADILIVDDYAHHPSEIKATMETARLMRRPLRVVFQPHRYTRLKSLYREFMQSFEHAEHLIVTDIYAASEAPIAGISSQKFVSDMLAATGSNIQYVPKKDVLDCVSQLAQPGDVVLMLGAGDITQMAHELASQWQKTKDNMAQPL